VSVVAQVMDGFIAAMVYRTMLEVDGVGGKWEAHDEPAVLSRDSSDRSNAHTRSRFDF